MAKAILIAVLSLIVVFMLDDSSRQKVAIDVNQQRIRSLQRDNEEISAKLSALESDHAAFKDYVAEVFKRVADERRGRGASNGE